MRTCRYSSFPQSDALVGFKSAYTAEQTEPKVTQEQLQLAEEEKNEAEAALDEAEGVYDTAANELSRALIRRRTRGGITDVSDNEVARLKGAVDSAKKKVRESQERLDAANLDYIRKQEIHEQQQRRNPEREREQAPQDDTKAGMYASLTAPQFPRPEHWKKSRVGQKLAKDERWPAWLTPKPQLSSGANLETLTDDQMYMDQFGAYLSETMLAAMDDVVSEIRVMATLSRQVRRIPIRRLVAEPLVSNWFAKWIATVILKNRALVGKTWHKDTILDNIAKQLDECRAFFYDPQKYGAGARVFEDMPPLPIPADDDVGDEEEDDDDDDERYNARRNSEADGSDEDDDDDEEEEEEEEEEAA